MSVVTKSKKRVILNPCGAGNYEIAVDGVRVVKHKSRFHAIAWCQGRFPAKDIKINDYWDPDFSKLPRSLDYKNFASNKITEADARSVIDKLRSELKQLFDEKLSDYDYYQNNEAVVGFPGMKGKICFVDISRTVLTKDNPSKINNEIKSLLDEAKSLADKYVGMKIKEDNITYVGLAPTIHFDAKINKTDCSIHMTFEEVDVNDSKVEDSKFYSNENNYS